MRNTRRNGNAAIEHSLMVISNVIKVTITTRFARKGDMEGGRWLLKDLELVNTDLCRWNKIWIAKIIFVSQPENSRSASGPRRGFRRGGAAVG